MKIIENNERPDLTPDYELRGAIEEAKELVKDKRGFKYGKEVYFTDLEINIRHNLYATSIYLSGNKGEYNNP